MIIHQHTLRHRENGQRCPEAQHCHRHSARSQKFPIEISCNNQICHHCPLHHHCHHKPKCSVGKHCQVTVGPVALSCDRFYQAVPGNSCPVALSYDRFYRAVPGNSRPCCSLIQFFLPLSARYQWSDDSWWLLFLFKSWIRKMTRISCNSTKYWNSISNGETSGENTDNLWCPILNFCRNLIPLERLLSIAGSKFKGCQENK